MAAPPFHWWRTVFFLIPAITVYTIVLGTLSLLSVLVDRQGHLAHKCARAWAWLILKTTGVSVDIEGLEHEALAHSPALARAGLVVGELHPELLPVAADVALEDLRRCGDFARARLDGHILVLARDLNVGIGTFRRVG